MFCGILDTFLISESRNVDTKILAVEMSIKVISCKKKSGTLDVKKCQIVDPKKYFFTMASSGHHDTQHNGIYGQHNCSQHKQ